MFEKHSAHRTYPRSLPLTISTPNTLRHDPRVTSSAIVAHALFNACYRRGWRRIDLVCNFDAAVDVFWAQCTFSSLPLLCYRLRTVHVTLLRLVNPTYTLDRRRDMLVLIREGRLHSVQTSFAARVCGAISLVACRVLARCHAIAMYSAGY